MQTKTVIERAFELARGGNCHSVADIIRVLKTEQYVNIDSHLYGPVLRKQLTALMK